MNIRKSLVPVALAAALVFSLPVAASAADAPANKAEKRLELLRANAGEPVKTVKFLRPMHGFEVVGPHNVLVWETPFKAWLLDLRESPACQKLENEWTVAFETMYDTLNTANGYIVGDHGIRCRIDGIREVDVKAWRAAEREAGIRDPE